MNEDRKTSRLRIAIASAGRFHVLDLARELHALGHHVRFYSYVPQARVRQFGLPDECHVSLLPFALPVMAWERLLPRVWSRLRERLLYAVLNWAVMLRLAPCDAFICMSGIYLEAARFAKRRHGAAIWLERGSRHILSQDEILAAIPGAERPSRLSVDRELAGYALADRIVIPSEHVAKSFSRDSAAKAKLFLNTYGVDLSMFPAGPDKQQGKLVECLFVGIWCLRKGCDLLVAAVRDVMGVRLTHIGALGDCAFPRADARFVHIDPMPQAELAKSYAPANIFILASREDGFGVVVVQALASGLPVICSDRTGGADLACTPTLAARITVVPAGNAEALTSALAGWRDRLRGGERLPPLDENDRQALSWRGYGQRYSSELLRSSR